MAELPAFLAFTLGPALTYELGLLVAFILLLNLKRMIYHALAQLKERDRPED